MSKKPLEEYVTLKTFLERYEGVRNILVDKKYKGEKLSDWEQSLLKYIDVRLNGFFRTAPSKKEQEIKKISDILETVKRRNIACPFCFPLDFIPATVRKETYRHNSGIEIPDVNVSYCMHCRRKWLSNEEEDRIDQYLVGKGYLK